MKIIKLLAVAISAAFFIAGSAFAQNVGTTTLNSLAAGKGIGKQGFTPVGPCTNLYTVTWQAGVPTCGQIDMAAGVTGTLAIGNGGTGTTTYLSALQAWGLQVPNLTHKAVPVGADKIGFYDVAGGAYKYSTLTELLGSITSGVSSIAGNTGAFTLGTGLTNSGNVIQQNNSMGANKYQVFASGSGTITTPTGANWVKFTITGGGGGGSGAGATAGTGTTGGNSCINTSGAACTTPVYQSGGGTGGNFSTGAGGASGAISGSSSCTVSFLGGSGAAEPPAVTAAGSSGSPGGNSTWGGAGAASFRTTGETATANTGSGGQGGGTGTAAVVPGSGGGAGPTCIAFLQSPAASYTYAVGASGAGGAAGTSGTAGGAGGNGVIIAEYGFN